VHLEVLSLSATMKIISDFIINSFSVRDLPFNTKKLCCYHENRLPFEYVVIYRVLHIHTIAYDGSLNFSSIERRERESAMNMNEIFCRHLLKIIMSNEEEKFWLIF
jgi:hypothetical protein